MFSLSLYSLSLCTLLAVSVSVSLAVWLSVPPSLCVSLCVCVCMYEYICVCVCVSGQAECGLKTFRTAEQRQTKLQPVTGCLSVCVKSHIGGGPALPGEPREAGHFQHHVLYQPTRGHVATDAADPGADQRWPGWESKPAAKVRTRVCVCVCVCLHLGELATKIRSRCGCCRVFFCLCFFKGKACIMSASVQRRMPVM